MYIIILRCSPNYSPLHSTWNCLRLVYAPSWILVFMEEKSMGCEMMEEYPGAMASVTGQAKNCCGSLFSSKPRRCSNSC